MPSPPLHQFLASAFPGDAATGYALLLQRWLRQMGYASEIFVDYASPELAEQVQPVAAYRRAPGESGAIYHHCTGADVVDWLIGQGLRLMVIYHNITPPGYFGALDPGVARQLQRGREQLAPLRAITDLAAGVSPYNVAELEEAGFAPTAVLPLTLDPDRYAAPPQPDLLAELRRGGPLLLFVGRLAPNKKQEDLIKLMYYVRRIRPAARLALVGEQPFGGYASWLAGLARELGLDGAVHFAGRVSDQALFTYYRAADLYVSMSEHEGFGQPFLESMLFDLPVLAYAAAGVPGTLDTAGVLFHDKNLPALAELVDLLLADEALRQRLIAGQRARVQAFSPAAVWACFAALVSQFVSRVTAVPT